MCLFFFKFNDSLLTLNQIDNLFSSAFSILVKQSLSLWERKMFILSANNISIIVILLMCWLFHWCRAEQTKAHVSYIYNKCFISEICFMQIFFNLAPTFAVHHEKSFVPDFLVGTGSRFSACLLIKLLFSNLSLIPSVNNLTHMYLSLFRVYFKVEVYFRVTWSRM